MGGELEYCPRRAARPYFSTLSLACNLLVVLGAVGFWVGTVQLKVYVARPHEVWASHFVVDQSLEIPWRVFPCIAGVAVALAAVAHLFEGHSVTRRLALPSSLVTLAVAMYAWATW